jgi:hypothetical protein
MSREQRILKMQARVRLLQGQGAQHKALGQVRVALPVMGSPVCNNFIFLHLPFYNATARPCFYLTRSQPVFSTVLACLWFFPLLFLFSTSWLQSSDASRPPVVSTTYTLTVLPDKLCEAHELETEVHQVGPPSYLYLFCGPVDDLGLHDLGFGLQYIMSLSQGCWLPG